MYVLQVESYPQMSVELCQVIFTEVEIKKDNCVVITEIIYGFSGPLQFSILPDIHKKSRFRMRGVVPLD